MFVHCLGIKELSLKYYYHYLKDITTNINNFSQYTRLKGLILSKVILRKYQECTFKWSDGVLSKHLLDSFYVSSTYITGYFTSVFHGAKG